MIETIGQWPLWGQVAVGVALGHFISTWVTWVIGLMIAGATQ